LLPELNSHKIGGILQRLVQLFAGHKPVRDAAGDRIFSNLPLEAGLPEAQT
jgi:hypothetical protein